MAGDRRVNPKLEMRVNKGYTEPMGSKGASAYRMRSVWRQEGARAREEGVMSRTGDGKQSAQW